MKDEIFPYSTAVLYFLVVVAGVLIVSAYLFVKEDHHGEAKLLFRLASPIMLTNAFILMGTYAVAAWVSVVLGGALVILPLLIGRPKREIVIPDHFRRG